jgi:hypothetical protein
MGEITLTLKQAFRASFAKRLWAFYIIVGILAWIVGMIANLPMQVYGRSLEQAMLAQAGPIELFAESDPILFIGTMFEVFMQTLPFLAAAFIVTMLLSLLAEAFFSGMALNGPKLFLEGERGIESLVSKSWGKTKPRIKTAFLTSILINILSLLVIIITIGPFVLQIASEALQIASDPAALLVGTASPELLLAKLISIAMTILAIWLVLLLVILLLSPILALIAPVVYFEDKGVIDSIKRAISLGKNRYLRNLAYLVLLWLIIITAIIIIMLPMFLVIFIPLLGVLLVLPWILLFIIFILWVQAFSYLAMVKYYELATNSQ